MKENILYAEIILVSKVVELNVIDMMSSLRVKM